MTVSHRRDDLRPGVPNWDSEAFLTSSVTDRIPLPRNRVSVPHFEVTLGRASAGLRSPPKISRNLHKLVQGGLQILGNLGGDHVRIGEIGRILQALVLQPENIQADFVTFQQVFVSEGLEAL